MIDLVKSVNNCFHLIFLVRNGDQCVSDLIQSLSLVVISTYVLVSFGSIQVLKTDPVF